MNPLRATLLILALTLTGAGPAGASGETSGREERSGGYLGIGFGPARGAFYGQEEGDTWWDTGGSPQVRLGWFLGRRVSIGLETLTWFSERGTAGDLPLQLKGRVTGHIWAAAATWYPSDSDGFPRGLFLRGAAGPAIANYAAAIPDPTDPLGAREIQVREDEWGWGVTWAVGYEARVSEHFGAGLQVTSTHLWIDEYIRRVWFGGPVLHLAWYY